MPRFGTLIFLICGFYLIVTEADKSCNQMKMFSCHTCMGRDMENCDWGITCCKGACWKLIDDTNNLIAKGCTAEPKEDGISEQDFIAKGNKPINGNDIKGVAHFCAPASKEAKDLDAANLCNGASPLTLSVTALLSALTATIQLLRSA